MILALRAKLENQTLKFHPLIVLASGIFIALLIGLVVIWRFEGERRTSILYYSVPMAVPFVAFCFERLERWGEIQWLVDVPVVIMALTRAFIAVPFFSGHALFLTYTLLTTRGWLARWTAGMMLLAVIYLKVFRWQDMTIVGGVLLGMFTVLIDTLLVGATSEAQN